MLQTINSSEEQSRKEQETRDTLHKSVTDALKGDKIQNAILADLGLSPEPDKKEEKAPAKKEKVVEDDPKEEEQEDHQETQEDDNQEADDDDSKGDSKDDEEVIPKSKIQPRIDKLTAQIKAQQKELDEIRASKANESKDEVTKQLEGMTTAELKAAKLEVRKAQVKAHNDDAKLNELLALEDKIDNVMSDAPKNFIKAQAAAYAKKANQIAESGDIDNLDKAAPQIIKIANEIYAEYPSLQKDVNGQATALDMAVKHYKALNTGTGGDKSKEVELKRQNNNLKRKVTLDTKSGKPSIDKAKLDTLKKNAIGGTMRQKVELIRSHPAFNVDAMIPDELRER